ncbi:MAG: cell division protein FtsZ [Rhodospirillales bacterium]|nr:cell division protein FtsZ [Rhodospirillales bacterium]
MSINFLPKQGQELKPRITVIGVGGAGGNAVNNMISSRLEGVEFIVANTDAQSLSQSRTDRRIQLGSSTTQGLGAGSRPDIGRAAAEETIEEILGQLQGSNMVFITAGMGGGTGTGAAPVIARAAREHGILTVGVVTKPFTFEGAHRMRTAEAGIEELHQYVDTLIIIPNQNLFRVASERTTFADAFKMADDVLYSGVRGVTDLMIMPGLINLDFADIRTVMSEMGKAMMGTGEAEGDNRALSAAEAAISNPLLDDTSMKGARGVLINITGGPDMTLFEVDEAANRIRDEVDPDANIIFGSTFDENMEGKMRVSVVATGIDCEAQAQPRPTLISLVEQKRTMGPRGFERPAAAAPSFRPQATAQSVAFAMPQEAVAPTENSVALATAQPIEAAENAPAAPAEEAAAGEGFNLHASLVGRGEVPLPADEVAAAPAPKPAVEAVRPVETPRQAEQAEPPRRAPTLFERVTGAHRARQAAARPPAKEEPGPAVQPRLTGLDRADRLPTSRPDDELLDIPAFLRRQAN